jgi:hypothetical protein
MTGSSNSGCSIVVRNVMLIGIPSSPANDVCSESAETDVPQMVSPTWFRMAANGIRACLSPMNLISGNFAFGYRRVGTREKIPFAVSSASCSFQACVASKSTLSPVWNDVSPSGNSTKTPGVSGSSFPFSRNRIPMMSSKKQVSGVTHVHPSSAVQYSESLIA